MRCPKCGYISFDHLETCGKCNKDLSAVSASLGGGLYSVEAPHFLVFAPEPDTASEQFDLAEDSQDDVIALDDDYIDSDLEFLVADDEGDFEADSDHEIEGPEIEGLGIELPEVEEKFDFTGTEDVELGDLDADGLNFDELAEDEMISLSLPDELSDISDLSAPVIEDINVDAISEVEPLVEPIPEPSAPVAEIDMELGDFELDLGSLDELMVLNDGNDADFELSLDDIDFSGVVSEEADLPVVDDGVVDMDSELDFELDLGGITLHKDK